MMEVPLLESSSSFGILLHVQKLYGFLLLYVIYLEEVFFQEICISC
jgi:hypothetical protein